MNNEKNTNDTTEDTTLETPEGTSQENAPEAGQENEGNPEALNELVKAVHHNGLVALGMHFKDVEGRVVGSDFYGPVFIFRVSDKNGDRYACGYFLRELVNRFQSGNDPAGWMASFFYELMKTEGGKELPEPPSGEEEAKAVIDKVLVPQLLESIRDEFAPEPIHAGLALNEEYGPVFEAGFPSITEGNNVCAFPLHLLLTHLQLNRDPSELLIQGMYSIRREHGLE
ncbi:hypothetical protein [Paenibacillus spiritus]|nr:hypothetical protein [Paenibacillus spiritus]